MPTGVKQIGWLAKHGETWEEQCKPNRLLVVKPDLKVTLYVTEWQKDTSPTDREKKLIWFLEEENTRSVIEEMNGVKIYICLEKKYCGSYLYYVAASLTTERGLNDTGLKIRGHCEQKLISCKWCTVQNGNDVTTSKVFSYGEPIYLQLDTEGLNGDMLTVEVYSANHKNKDNTDIMMNSYLVAVEDGEMNLMINDTHFWQMRLAKAGGMPWMQEKFYIKISYSNDRYHLLNGSEKMGLHLQLQNLFNVINHEPSTGISPLLVGKADKYPHRFGGCIFKKLVLTEAGEPTTIFDDGKFERRTTNDKPENSIQQINYYFNKYDIRPDAKPTVDALAQFLLESPYLPVEIGSHTDSVGSGPYNMELSNKRAKTIVEYLIAKGVARNRITAHGYGKTNLLVPGDNINNERNRRTTLKFRIYDNDAQPILYEMIAPGHAKPETITIAIKDEKHVGCFALPKNKHTDTHLVKEIDGDRQSQTIKGSTIAYPVYSMVSNFNRNWLEYLLKYMPPPRIQNMVIGIPPKEDRHFTTSFLFYINSCAYYSIKTNPTVQVLVYPDIVWIGHFQYNFKDKGDYYFHNKPLDLTTGIDEVMDRIRHSTVYKMSRILPAAFVNELVMGYIQQKSERFTYGVHAFYDRLPQKKGADLLLDGTKVNLITNPDLAYRYNKYAAAGVIVSFVLIGIAIDLVLIYLTDGKAELTEAGATLAKNIEAAKKLGLLVPPSIAINTGMYFNKDVDGKLGIFHEINIKASPLVSLDYKKDFNLLDRLKTPNKPTNAEHPTDAATLQKLETNNKNKGIIASALEKAGLKEVKGSFEIKGTINFEQNTVYSELTKSFKCKENKDIIELKNDEWLIKTPIFFTASLDVSYKNAIKFKGLQANIEGKLDFDLKGSATIKLKYGAGKSSKNGNHVAVILCFSGLEGTYIGKLDTGVKFFKWTLFENEIGSDKPMPFTLMEPFELPLYHVDLFQPND